MSIGSMRASSRVFGPKWDSDSRPSHWVHHELAVSPGTIFDQVLTGIKREGIIATEFTVAGPISELAVTAKPLSTLTPGITRDLVRPPPNGRWMWSGDSPSGGAVIER